MDGQPLPNANVIFEGQGPQGDSASAYTDANGHFQLKDTIQTVGAKPGQYLVRITAQAVDEYSKPPAIPPKYNRNSQILVTVTNGSNTFNYELKSDPRYKSVEQ
ncbi:carboxypeptidase-like regulatory domain-containing protein [Blastopirellula sp. J2-11]|nr:carboxypeptidase-like regulatory domain-containing protein [Blastopirellula sp. J2-11]